MASPFVTVAVRNSAGVVINATVSATIQNTEIHFDQGNYPCDQTKTFQLPGAATSIVVVIKYEAFIDDWKTVYSQTLPATTGWQNNNASFDVTGHDTSVKVSGPTWS